MIRRALVGLLAAALLAATAHAAPVRITDDLQHVVAFDQPPRRIVALLPSLTETVCALGDCDRLVGVDRYSNWPAQVEKLPKLGGLDDPQVEAIVALRPDVVLLAPSLRIQDRLEALGLKVLVLQTRTQADVRRVFQALGEMLGRPDPLAPWRAIDADMARIAATVPPSMHGRSVYFEVDAAPYAAGASSFIGETLARLGLRNVVGPELGPFPKLNPEFVVRADPELVMIGRRNADSLAGRPGWSRIRALKAHAVCAFDPAESDVIARPGPRMAQGAEAMARCLRRLADASAQ